MNGFPTTAGQDWSSHPETDLDDLRRCWGFQYDIAFDRDGYWHARHVTSGDVMDAGSAKELQEQIRADYAARTGDGPRLGDLR
jgi:hypothetical protein